MKKILFISGLFMLALVLTAGITAQYDANALNTFACSFAGLGVASLIMQAVPMPTGVFGNYIGAPGVTTESGGAGVQVTTSERARGAYTVYRTNEQYAGKDITPSYLRLETVIKNDSRLSFKTFFGDGASVTATEKRLDRNDKFIITGASLTLMKQAKGKPGSGKQCTYPNPVEFGATAAAFLESIFNGELTMTLNRKKWLPAFDTANFLHVPQVQQSSSSNRDQMSSKSKFVPFTPHIELDGSGTNEIEIAFPTYAGWDGATPAVNTDEHIAVLTFHGLLIVGGSSNV